MQTVYVSVKASERLPNEHNVFFNYVEIKVNQSVALEGLMSATTFDMNRKQFIINERYEMQPTHWLEKTEAVLLTKEDAEKIKSIDYNKALEMSKEVYPDNMGGMDEKGVNRYRAGYAKGYIDALTILNKNL